MMSPGCARPWETSPVTNERHNGRSSRRREAKLPAGVAQHAAPFTPGEVSRLERRQALPSRIIRSRRSNGTSRRPPPGLPLETRDFVRRRPCCGSSCRFLAGHRAGVGTPQVPQGATDPLPPLRQPARPCSHASGIRPHACVVGMAFLLPVVMLCCQLGASKPPPKQGAGVLLHSTEWSSSRDAALPHR